MSLIRAVLFDLDGTLLDTLDGLTSGVNHAMRDRGVSERTRDEVRQFAGNGVRKLIARALPGGEDNPDYETALAAFRASYAAHAIEGSTPYPGIPELLADLRARGIALGVVTNKDANVSRALLDHFFPGAFAFVAGGSEGRPPKPDPAGALDALRAMGAEPGEALFIGDSDVDADTARQAGLPAILCSWGFRPRESLEPLAPVVDRPEQILGCSQVSLRAKSGC